MTANLWNVDMNMGHLQKFVVGYSLHQHIFRHCIRCAHRLLHDIAEVTGRLKASVFRLFLIFLTIRVWRVSLHNNCFLFDISLQTSGQRGFNVECRTAWSIHFICNFYLLTKIPIEVHAKPIIMPGGVDSYNRSEVNFSRPKNLVRFSVVTTIGSSALFPSSSFFPAIIKAALRKI